MNHVDFYLLGLFNDFIELFFQSPLSIGESRDFFDFFLEVLNADFNQHVKVQIIGRSDFLKFAFLGNVLPNCWFFIDSLSCEELNDPHFFLEFFDVLPQVADHSGSLDVLVVLEQFLEPLYVGHVRLIHFFFNIAVVQLSKRPVLPFFLLQIELHRVFPQLLVGLEVFNEFG